MGHVDDDAQVVHALHDLYPELAEASVVALEDTVADVGLATVGQTCQPYPGVIEHVHPVQLVADGQVLHRGQEPHLVLLLGRLYLGGAPDMQYVVMPGDVRNHHADLVQQVGKPDERHLAGMQHPAKNVGLSRQP